MVADIRAPTTERVGNRPSLHLPHRATSRLYQPNCIFNPDHELQLTKFSELSAEFQSSCNGELTLLSPNVRRRKVLAEIFGPNRLKLHCLKGFNNLVS